MEDAFSKKSALGVQSHNYYKYKITYIVDEDTRLIFLFVTGLNDDFDSIKKELKRCKKEFLSIFENVLRQLANLEQVDSETYKVFDPTVDSIHRNLRPKISLVGFSGVGKTTITKLIKAEEIPMKHVPTITGDIATIKIGKLHFHLWDFAGQEQFSYLWGSFMKGSDAILLITDSSLENVKKSRFFLELIKEQVADAHTAVIANKQDLPDTMKPDQIEHVIGLKTYSMIAKDPKNRNKMIQIIADVLEMSAEISPLLRPLLKRDQLMEEAAGSLQSGDFNKALILFEEISDLCIELGDDSLGKEFYEKSIKIREMLKEPEIPKVPITEPSQVPETQPTPKSLQAPEKQPKSEPLNLLDKLPPAESPNIIEKLAEQEKSQAPKTSVPKQIQAPEKPSTLEKPEHRTVFDRIETLEGPKELKEPEEKKKSKKKKRFKKVLKLKKEKLKKEKQPKKAKKKRKVKTPKIPVATDTTSIIEKPSFLKNLEESKTPTKEDISVIPKEKPKSEKEDLSWVPESLKRFQKQQVSPTEGIKTSADETTLIKPLLTNDKLGLNLNPEDFTIKQRPKQVGAIELPKSDKTKLTTSAYGHVANPSQTNETTTDSPIKSVKESTKTKIPNAPEIKKKSKIETPTTKTDEFPQLDEILDDTQKIKNLEDELIDLKIKKTKLEKMSLEFEMQELMGDITSEDLKEKTLKLVLIEKKTDEQIERIKKILEDLGA